MSVSSASLFLPTPSARRATSSFDTHSSRNPNFYPRPPRGGRPGVISGLGQMVEISTHALREEGDDVGLPGDRGQPDFYPRPPRGGRREVVSVADSAAGFLPTPSARRATGGCFRGRQCGGISTHALREEGDRFPSLALTSICRFLPTPSARRATTLQLPPHYAEADFYPRPPRGGRQPGLGFVRKARQISTHALREEGDQIDGHHTLAAARISTHALREEGD